MDFKSCPFSFLIRSCLGISDLFRCMFSDSEIASQFHLSKTKCSYFINHCFAPYFKDILVNVINMLEFFTVSFDESMNAEMQNCQMDVAVRFWDKTKNQAATCYFDSKFILRPNANELLTNLLSACERLNEEQFLQLAMDGPNINWCVLEMLDDQRVEKDLNKTLNIGSCSQHIIHGAFKDGVLQTDWGIHKLLKAMYWILHDSHARRDDYSREGSTNIFSLRYVYVIHVLSEHGKVLCRGVFPITLSISLCAIKI